MDLKAIQSILYADHLSEQIKTQLILRVIADDKKAIPYIMEILDQERETNHTLISESNAELSRALLTLEDPKLGTKKPMIQRSFVTGEIRKHFIKWQNTVRCTFKMDGLP